jgi:FKBP-type peptidyl-prolyl cis-trans isomerase
MRRAAALAFIPLLAVAAVAGCGSSSSSEPAAAADTYKSVTVSGQFDKAPNVVIPKVQGNGGLYTKTVIQGTGATVTSAQGVIGNSVAYDWSGTTSKLLGSSYSLKSSSLFVRQANSGLATTLDTALVGQKLGSRVLMVIPPKDGFGSSGDQQDGIGGTDTLVFVVDMISTFGTASVPGTQPTTAGGTLPTVTPPAAGSTAGPAIKIPAKVAAPESLQVKTLIKGKGAVVKKGQELAVQYTGVNWRTGKVFDSSWARKAPLTTPIGEGQVIPGWDTGLVGQTVGSRVLLVIPPADGYGSSGLAQAGIKGTDTLVFVVDILAAV